VFRPAIQKLSVLIGMALFCILMVFFSFNSLKDYKKSFYNQKVTASNYMFNAMKVLRSSFLNIPNQKLDEGEVYIDSNNNKTYDTGEEIINDGRPFSSLDPLETGLVFYQDDLAGNPTSKLSTLNPSFAAFIVDLMQKAGLKKISNRSAEPNVAIAFSSSFPGANIAVLSACRAMNIEPVIITSLSGSNYGAISYDEFSWLDMEKILIDQKIFPSTFQSKAVSIGRGSDIGIGLDSQSIAKIKENIKKYDIDFIFRENETDLSYYIDARMNIYDLKNDFAPFDLFINVGGGHASIGSNEKIRKSHGILSSIFLEEIYEKDFDDCVLNRFSNSPNYSVSAINIIDIKNLISGKLPEINLSGGEFSIDWTKTNWVDDSINNHNWFLSSKETANLFIDRKYNFWIVIPCLTASLILVLSVGIYSHFQIKKRMSSYEPD
tara:strand:- start:363 stop:1667 length:1305 start_codon:yes stop_codon:yes gene_type:complete